MPLEDPESPSKTLSTVLYRSRSVFEAGHKSDLDILDEAIARNEKLGITGFLVRAPGAFCQIIEGKRENVEEVYAKIEGDQRHTIEHAQWSHGQTARGFKEWFMAMLITASETQYVYGMLEDPGLSLEFKVLFMRSLALRSRDRGELVLGRTRSNA